MPIVDTGGRPRSIRTVEEEMSVLSDDIRFLPPSERRAFEEICKQLEDGDQQDYEQIANVEYENAPVGIETYLRDPYFLGETGGSLWDRLKDDLIELFEGDYHEAALGGSLGWGKCLVKSTNYVDCENGTRVEIGNQVGKKPLVSSFDGTVNVAARASEVWKSGRKQCVRMTIASGQKLEASLDHPVLCPNGYVPLRKIRTGDLVAVAKTLPSPKKELQITDAEVIVAAALLADGGMTGSNTIYSKQQLKEEVVKYAKSVPGFNGTREIDEGNISLNGLHEWTTDLGIRCLSKDKRVPAHFFGLSDKQLSLFLRWIYTDGNVYAGTPRKIEICLASEGFIDDIQWLLKRFGIVARKSYRLKKNQDGEFDAWRLQIADIPNQVLFFDKIGLIPGKEAHCRALLDATVGIESNSNWNVVPITNVELKEIRRETGPHKNEFWNKLAGQADGTYMGRERFERLCRAVGYAGRFYRFVRMDVIWERVKEIEPLGYQDVYDLSVPETKNVAVNGGLIVHNTFFATTAISYIIYQMSCLRDPQSAYGIAPGSSIIVAMLSVTEKIARRVPVNELIGKITHSRYFKEKFPSKAAPSLLEIRFPKQVMVVAGSTGSSAIIGMNAFAGFIDETSFMGVSKEYDRMGREVVTDRGKAIYKSIIRRMKSRFLKVGRLPGLMLLASSKERPNAFVEERIEQAREQTDAHFFVREYATWDVKKEGSFTSETFKVVVGNEKHHSRILTDETGEEEEKFRKLELRVIEIPLEYKPDFERDLDGSIRDIAGYATISVSPYIHRTEMVYEAADDTLVCPVGGSDPGDIQEEWLASTPLEIHWGKIARSFERRLPGGYTETAWRPIRHPEAIRYAHIDPSLSGDCSGLTIAHNAGWTEVVRRDIGGEEYNELAPVIETDLMLRIIPPPGDEILLSDVRAIIYQFVEHGFNVRYVSMDSYQSADALQQLRKRGIEAEVVSVDKTSEPYDLLKTTMYESRLRMHLHKWCQRELTQLQRVPRPRGKGFKIDHPKIGPDGQPGTKDVADSLAAVVYTLTQRTPGAPVPIQKGLTDREVGEKDDYSWVTGGKTIISQESSRNVSSGGIVGTRPDDPTMKPMPFVKG